MSVWRRRVWRIAGLVTLLCVSPGEAGNVGTARGPSLPETIAAVQPKMVKIYGVGGPQGMEDYQSGFLISAEGHVLTAWSYVLDTDAIDVRLADGRKLAGKLLGADPRLEVAVLKVEAADLPHFDLARAVEVEAGERVLALSNAFGVAVGNEPVTVQQGTVSLKTRLDARRGAFESPYRGPVYILDMATNNPGAAGGALVTRRGELVAMLGKELRNALNNTWLNYAIPIGELRPSVEQIRAGKFVLRREEASSKKPTRGLTPELLGLVLVPDVVERTPPFLEATVPESAAAVAGLRPDDLIVFVNERLVPSCKALKTELEWIPAVDPVTVTVLRGQELVSVVLEARPPGGR